MGVHATGQENALAQMALLERSASCQNVMGKLCLKGPVLDMVVAREEELLLPSATVTLGGVGILVRPPDVRSLVARSVVAMVTVLQRPPAYARLAGKEKHAVSHPAQLKEVELFALAMAPVLGRIHAPAPPDGLM